MFDYDGMVRRIFLCFGHLPDPGIFAEIERGLFGAEFGFGTDKITPEDFDGDGKTDIAVYRPETGIWYVFQSSTGTVDYTVFGLPRTCRHRLIMTATAWLMCRYSGRQRRLGTERTAATGRSMRYSSGCPKTNLRSETLMGTVRRYRHIPPIGRCLV